MSLENLTKIASPFPVHLPLTVGTRFIEIAGSTCHLIDHRRRLQSVGEDDVWVHGSNIQMVNEGLLNAIWLVFQRPQLVFDVTANLKNRESPMVCCYFK